MSFERLVYAETSCGRHRRKRLTANERWPAKLRERIIFVFMTVGIKVSLKREELG